VIINIFTPEYHTAMW